MVNKYNEDILRLRQFFEDVPKYDMSTMTLKDYPMWSAVRREIVEMRDTEEAAKNYIDYVVSEHMVEASRDPQALLQELGRNRYAQMYQIFRFFINDDPKDTRLWDLYSHMLNAGKGFSMSFQQGTLFITNSGGSRGRKRVGSGENVVATCFERLLSVYFGFVCCEKARQAMNRRKRAPKRRRSNSGDIALTDADIPTNKRGSEHVYVCVLTVVEAWKFVLGRYNITDIDEFTKHFLKFDHIIIQLSTQPDPMFTVYRHYKWTESSIFSAETPQELSEHGPTVLQSMRAITGHILTDIEKIVTDPNYYQVDDAQTYPALASFVIPTNADNVPTGALPSRFDELPDGIFAGMASLRDTQIPAQLVVEAPSEVISHDSRTRSSRAASRTRRSETQSASRVSADDRATRPPPQEHVPESQPPMQPPSRSESASGAQESAAQSVPFVPDIDLRTTSAHINESQFERLALRTGVVQTKYVPKAANRHILADIEHERCPGDGCPCHAAKAHLEKKMRLFFRSYACSFEDLVATDQGAVPDSALVNRTVAVTLSDPPFNIRRQAHRANSAHDFFNRTHITSLVDVTSEILRPGGMSLTYCSDEQYGYYKDGFTRKTEEHSDDPDKLVKCFQVMDATYIIAQKEGHDSRMPNQRGLYTNILQQMSVARRMENGIMFPAQPIRSGGFVHASYRPHTNILNNVERLPPGEQVRVPSSTEDRSTMALRPEQKPLSEIMEFISRHTEGGDTVVDFCSGTNTTGVACVILPENRRFVGCDVDEVAQRVGNDRMLQAFVERLITDGLTFDDDEAECTEQDREQALLYLSHLEPVREPRESKNWRAPTNLPSFTTLPIHHLTFMGNIHSIEGVRRYHHTPVDLWDVAMTSALDCTSMDSLLGVDLGMSYLERRKSRIRHDSAGFGIFTTRSFKKGALIAQVYGTLVYHDISVRVEVTKRYGQGPLGVTVADFNNLRYSIPVSGDHFKNDDGHDISVVYFVPAKCSVLTYINDPRYCDGDTEIANKDGEEARTANVELHISPKVLPITDRSKICSHTLFELRTLADINIGEEL